MDSSAPSWADFRFQPASSDLLKTMTGENLSRLLRAVAGVALMAL
jgi:hypothetical protein